MLVSCPGIEDGATYSLSVGSSNYTITMDGLIYGSSQGGSPGGGFPGGGFPGGGMQPPGRW